MSKPHEQWRLGSIDMEAGWGQDKEQDSDENGEENGKGISPVCTNYTQGYPAIRLCFFPTNAALGSMYA